MQRRHSISLELVRGDLRLRHIHGRLSVGDFHRGTGVQAGQRPRRGQHRVRRIKLLLGSRVAGKIHHVLLRGSKGIPRLLQPLCSGCEPRSLLLGVKDRLLRRVQSRLRGVHRLLRRGDLAMRRTVTQQAPHHPRRLQHRQRRIPTRLGSRVRGKVHHGLLRGSEVIPGVLQSLRRHGRGILRVHRRLRHTQRSLCGGDFRCRCRDIAVRRVLRYEQVMQRYRRVQHRLRGVQTLHGSRAHATVGDHRRRLRLSEGIPGVLHRRHVRGILRLRVHRHLRHIHRGLRGGDFAGRVGVQSGQRLRGHQHRVRCVQTILRSRSRCVVDRHVSRLRAGEGSPGVGQFLRVHPILVRLSDRRLCVVAGHHGRRLRVLHPRDLRVRGGGIGIEQLQVRIRRCDHRIRGFQHPGRIGRSSQGRLRTLQLALAATHQVMPVNRRLHGGDGRLGRHQKAIYPRDLGVRSVGVGPEQCQVSRGRRRHRLRRVPPHFVGSTRRKSGLCRLRRRQSTQRLFGWRRHRLLRRLRRRRRSAASASVQSECKRNRSHERVYLFARHIRCLLFKTQCGT